MTSSKILRLILAFVCIALLVIMQLLPLLSQTVSMLGVSETSYTTLYDFLGTQDTMVLFFLIITFIALAALLATLVLSLIFPVKNKVVGLVGIIAGGLALISLIMFIVKFLSDGGLQNFEDALGIGYKYHIGYGVYIDIALAIAAIVLSVLIMTRRDGNKGGKSPKPEPVNGGRAPQGGFVPPARPPMSNAHIVGLNGVYQNASFDVSDGRPVMFGRDTNTCSVIFDQFETAVSRQHCIVTFLPNANMYSVRDMSKNGTYIGSMNNRMPNNVEQNVQRGTILYLGSSKNSFKLD